jgi:predicted molibdopterin-dependent oxidoreductase YjgC
MGAISVVEKKAAIDLDECVECGVCIKAGVCPTESLAHEATLSEGRQLRKTFSDPWVTHPSTNVLGRGTEEMKTNEVTNRFGKGVCGMAAELGRPGIGTRFTDVEKVAKACAACGVEFEPCNPVTALMTDKSKGTIKPEFLNEKVLSAIVEFICPNEKVVPVLQAVKKVSGELDTVFSLEVCCLVDDDGTFPMYELIAKAGFTPSLNGKTNIGLGRLQLKAV